MKTNLVKQIDTKKELRILPLSKKQKLVITSFKAIDINNISEISHLTAHNNYTSIHLIDGVSHLSSKTLAHFAKNDKLTNFLRIHHSHLINPVYITQISKGDRHEVSLGADIKLPISRSNKQLITDYITSIL